MVLMPLKYQCITLVYTNLHKYCENGERDDSGIFSSVIKCFVITNTSVQKNLLQGKYIEAYTILSF